MARKSPGLIASHPSLTCGCVVAVLTAAALWLAPNDLTPLERGLALWDAFALTFIATLLFLKRKASATMMKARGYEDEGRHLILALCLFAAAASIAAIGGELSAARHTDDSAKSLRITAAFATVALSWLFTHLVFATHYAHEYYAPQQNGDGAREGLLFPGGAAPDFADFMHFALVIGVANQTADVQIASSYIRRTVTLHGIVAFLFNTVLLAMSINYAASLFS